jgi:hypothetical protein
MRYQKLAILTFFILLLPSFVAAQTVKDIKAVFAEGNVANGQYKNDYFGVTLTPANGRFTQGGFVSPEGHRARLIDVQSNASNWEEKYEIAILADAPSASPLVTSPTVYVRSLRHQLEREGFQTLQEEAPLKISGLSFVYATMKVGGEGHPHYRGLYTTFLNGYIVSLDVSAASVDRLNHVLRMVTFAPRR